MALADEIAKRMLAYALMERALELINEAETVARLRLEEEDRSKGIIRQRLTIKHTQRER